MLKEHKLSIIIWIVVIATIIAAICIITEMPKQDVKPPVSNTQQNQQYSGEMPSGYARTSTLSWANNAIFGNNDISKIESVSFVKNKRGDDAVKSWMFESFTCYMYGDNSMDFVVNGDYVHIKSESMYGAFSDMTALKEINGLNLLHTESVNNMSFMFKNCTSLETLDINQLNTSGLINAEGMFEASGIRSIDLSKNDFSNVQNMGYFVADCYNLEKIVFPQTPSVTNLRYALTKVGQGDVYPTKIEGNLTTTMCKNMSYMFYDSVVENYDIVENFDTQSLVEAQHMFDTCTIKSINLSKWNTVNLKDASYMFYDCSFLTSCNLDGWDVSNLKDCEAMFLWCDTLQSVNIGWINMHSIQNAAYLFKYCTMIKEINLSAFNNAEIGDTREMFAECYELATIYGDTFKSLSSDGMFLKCFALKGAKEYSENNVDINAANTEYYFTKKG